MSKKKRDTAPQKTLKLHFCPGFGLINTILSLRFVYEDDVTPS